MVLTTMDSDFVFLVRDPWCHHFTCMVGYVNGHVIDNIEIEDFYMSVGVMKD